MKKQYITSFTGGEKEVEALKLIAERDGKGLSYHIRKAIENYNKDLEEINYNLSDIINPLNNIEGIKYELILKQATYNGKKLNHLEIEELINMAKKTVNEFNKRF